MAVTITLQQAIELSSATDPAALYPGFFDAAVALVERYAPAAPASIANRAVLAVVEFLDWTQVPTLKFERTGDQSTIWDTKLTTNALRGSGAMAMLSPWKVRRAL